nr:hypothetical protein [Tanacetum cinerariifolium]
MVEAVMGWLRWWREGAVETQLVNRCGGDEDGVEMVTVEMAWRGLARKTWAASEIVDVTRLEMMLDGKSGVDDVVLMVSEAENGRLMRFKKYKFEQKVWLVFRGLRNLKN